MAKLDLRSVKKKDIDLRKVHIQERADAFKAENPKAKIVKVLKQLNRVEEQIRDAKRVKFALKGLEQAGVSFVYIPSIEAYSEEE